MASIIARRCSHDGHPAFRYPGKLSSPPMSEISCLFVPHSLSGNICFLPILLSIGTWNFWMFSRQAYS
jgi:hypothetical protein